MSGAHPARAARTVHGIDVARVEAAIQRAERQTSGEVRVAIARFYFWGDVRRAAAAAFERLHIDRTRQRNGVLIFVAPRLRRFAVIGDVGIHQRVSDAFWNEIAEQLGRTFRAGDLTAGLEQAVIMIGERLATHFPPDPHDKNELPDLVAT